MVKVNGKISPSLNIPCGSVDLPTHIHLLGLGSSVNTEAANADIHICTFDIWVEPLSCTKCESAL